MQVLKQSTAQTIILGPFVDDTDAVTPEDALVIAAADVRLSKNGAAFGAASAGGTHDENGYYRVTLAAGDDDTLGRLRVACFMAGALPVWEDFTVVTASAYNELHGGASGWAVQTYTVTVGGAACEGVHVMATTGADGTGEVARGYTDSSGKFYFVGETGTTYYLWCTKSGIVFSNPDTEVAL